MRFRYMSQARAEAILATATDEAMISITEPGLEANVKFSEPRLLRLQFDDHDPKNNSNLMMLGHIWDDQVPFTIEQANQIISFVREMRSLGVEYLFVHCHAGISRSRAVVFALWEWANTIGFAHEEFNPFRHEWNTKNSHVYRVMHEALYGKSETIFGE